MQLNPLKLENERKIRRVTLLLYKKFHLSLQSDITLVENRSNDDRVFTRKKKTKIL